jgi:hypothetical protein
VPAARRNSPPPNDKLFAFAFDLDLPAASDTGDLITEMSTASETSPGPQAPAELAPPAGSAVPAEVSIPGVATQTAGSTAAADYWVEVDAFPGRVQCLTSPSKKRPRSPSISPKNTEAGVTGGGGGFLADCTRAPDSDDILEHKKKPLDAPASLRQALEANLGHVVQRYQLPKNIGYKLRSGSHTFVPQVRSNEENSGTFVKAESGRFLKTIEDMPKKCVLPDNPLSANEGNKRLIIEGPVLIQARVHEIGALFKHKVNEAQRKFDEAIERGSLDAAQIALRALESTFCHGKPLCSLVLCFPFVVSSFANSNEFFSMN